MGLIGGTALCGGLLLPSCQSLDPVEANAIPKESVSLHSPVRSPITIGHSYTINSRVFHAKRTLNVCLPWGYEGRTESFPVVYLIDGGVDQDFLPIAGKAAVASLSGQYREFLLVGVQTEDRYFELTSPSDVPADCERIPKNGGFDLFLKHLTEEVRPFIEENFRVTDEDAILGESLAGLFITEAFLREPTSFQHFLAVSPSLWWRDMALSREAPVHLAGGDYRGRSLFLSMADEGGTMQEGLDQLVHALEHAPPPGLTWWYCPLPEEQHHTIYQPAVLLGFRRAFAFPPKQPDESTTAVGSSP